MLRVVRKMAVPGPKSAVSDSILLHSVGGPD